MSDQVNNNDKKDDDKIRHGKVVKQDVVFKMSYPKKENNESENNKSETEKED